MGRRGIVQRGALAAVIAVLMASTTVTAATAGDPPVVPFCEVAHNRSADTSRGYATITRTCTGNVRRQATITFRPTQLVSGSTTHVGSPVRAATERSTATRPLANHTFISNWSQYA